MILYLYIGKRCNNLVLKMASIRGQDSLLPVDYFHSKIGYRWDRFIHNTGFRVCEIISIILFCIGFGIWYFIGFKESGEIPAVFLVFAIIFQVISLFCGMMELIDYDIKELGFEGNVIMLNKIIKLRPSFKDNDKWAQIALDINNYVNKNNITGSGYIFYDGNDCKSYFKNMIELNHKYKKQEKTRKLKYERNKHYTKFKKSISKDKHRDCHHDHPKYYCDVSTQTDKDQNIKSNTGRKPFNKTNRLHHHGNNGNVNFNIDFGSNKYEDPLRLSSIHLENKYLKKKFKKAVKVYETESIKYWENKFE